MTRLNQNFPRLFAIATAVLLAALSTNFASAAEGDDQDAATIERYTGPPILLDEPETPPPASLVEKRVDKDEYPNGKVRYERQIARYSDDHFEADGFYREFYPNGEKFAEGQYKDGHQEGTWTYWHENGKEQRVVNYKNGQPDGTWDVLNAEGAVVAKRGFKDGKRDGTWVVYDKTGKQPLREEVYADGKADGIWKVWFPNGKLKTEAGLKAGVRDGAYKEWDDQGNQRAELNFVDGKPEGTATLWGAEGKKVVRHYKDGKLVKEEGE
jgi:antitoxin component YwqK of YwqJK toxin-antitoxin module